MSRKAGGGDAAEFLAAVLLVEFQRAHDMGIDELAASPADADTRLGGADEGTAVHRGAIAEGVAVEKKVVGDRVAVQPGEDEETDLAPARLEFILIAGDVAGLVDAQGVEIPRHAPARPQGRAEAGVGADVAERDPEVGHEVATPAVAVAPGGKAFLVEVAQANAGFGVELVVPALRPLETAQAMDEFLGFLGQGLGADDPELEFELEIGRAHV